MISFSELIKSASDTVGNLINIIGAIDLCSRFRQRRLVARREEILDKLVSLCGRKECPEGASKRRADGHACFYSWVYPLPLLFFYLSACHSDIVGGASGFTKEGIEAASRLFNSDFEHCATVQHVEVGTFWEYQLLGGNRECSWSSLFWGGTAQLQTFVSSAKPVDDYVHVELQTVTGHRGTPTRALLQLVKDEHGSPPAGTTSHATLLNLATREDGDIYVSEWVKFQPDIVDNIVAMPGDNGHWRTIWGMKTEGDYRIEAYIYTDKNDQPYWFVHGDNNANATKYGLPSPSSYEEYWRCTNGGPGPTCGSGISTVPISQGQWFHMEVFLHRSHGEDGRFWMAIDGQVLWDRWGSNYGVYNRQIDRVVLAALYGGIADGGEHSVYQWIDDIEIWDGFPCADPPCHRGVLEASLQKSGRVAWRPDRVSGSRIKAGTGG